MADPHPQLNRRQLLMRAGALGGSGAVFSMASALGLFAPTGAAAHQRFALDRLPAGDRKPRVLILGAGVGGLVAAYELDRAGFEVTVLEASARIGGRNFTARRGSVIDELGNPQTCAFDDAPDLYFNCGPARIPGSHYRLIDYCRQFGIKLEYFVNQNPNAYVQAAAFNDGAPMRQREYVADAKGFLAEFASKAVMEAQMEAPVGEEDRERLIAFLERYGDLGEDMLYGGTNRAGFAEGGLLRPGKLKSPRATMSELLKSPYWRFPMFFAEGETQFPAMMQPVGGMDQVVNAFVERVGARVTTGAILDELTIEAGGVRAVARVDGKPAEFRADFCFNSIPGHLMNGIRHNLPDDYRAILSEMRGSKLSKVGLQMKRRFWEDEEIYGGISWTDRDLLQIWYPSHGALGEKGVLLGGYVFGGEQNDRISMMSHEERIEAALDMGEQVHPGAYRAHYETGVSISWQRYNHMLGCGSGFGEGFSVGEEERRAIADKKMRLQKPVAGRYYMIGDQVSFHPGWQEGAIAISHQAVAHLRQSLADVNV